MAEAVRLPQLGLTMEGGTLLRWHRGEGDAVARGDVLFELETDKAVVEVEAEADGYLRGVRLAEGDYAASGTLVGWIAATREETLPAEDGSEAPAGQPTPAAGGEGAAGPHAVPTAAAAPLAAAPAPAPAPVETARDGGTRRPASPYARRIATEAGLDWHRLAGSGPHGRIVARDVQAALAGAQPPTPPGHAAPPPEALPPAAAGGSGGGAAARGAASAGPGTASAGPGPDAVAAMRRAVARRTSLAATIPQFAVSRTLDVSPLRDCLRVLAGRMPTAVTYTDCFLQASLTALARVPQLHASFRDGGAVPHTEPHVGLAVALQQGLVVPLLRPAPGASLLDLAAARAALVERARAGRLTAADLGDPTFVLSNLGGLGVDRFHALLDPAAGTILAIGAVRERPWVTDGRVTVAPVCEVTLTVDHRVGDGADAAAFLGVVAKYCESGEGLRIA